MYPSQLEMRLFKQSVKALFYYQITTKTLHAANKRARRKPHMDKTLARLPQDNRRRSCQHYVFTQRPRNRRLISTGDGRNIFDFKTEHFASFAA